MAIGNSLEEFVLGHGTVFVAVKVLLDLSLGILSSSSLIKEPEFTNEVLIVKINSVSLSTVGLPVILVEFRENSGLKLSSSMVGAHKSGKLDWESHPGLSEENV
jgi:hypothetical protein